VLSEYRVPHQVYYDHEEDVLRFGNYKDVIERVAPVAVDVFNIFIDVRVAEQFGGRNGGNIGPNVDDVRRSRQHIDVANRCEGTAFSQVKRNTAAATAHVQRPWASPSA